MKNNNQVGLNMISKIIGPLFNFNKISNAGLNPDQYQEIASSIAVNNWKRLRIFMVFTFFFETLLITFYDIPNIKNAELGSLWLPQAYFILHLIIGISAFLGIIFYSVFLNKRLDKKTRIDLFTPAQALSIMVCLSVITGLDQIKTGDISVFVINLLLTSVMVLVPGWLSLILFTVPFGVLTVGLFTYQPDVAIRNAHMINGFIFWIAVLIISKFMYDNHVSHIIKNIKLEEANQKLKILSLHDPLTNLANRRNFEEQIQHEMANVKRFNQHSWLILVDIDHFKNINDRFGHAIGDCVLKNVAELLQKNIRDVDLACRWGGEEFLLLITRTEQDEIMVVAERLCKDLAGTPFLINDQTISVTASFGIAPLAADDFIACYQQADQALYFAKHHGRNQVAIYNEQV
jgi:diguanylate cyclase